MALAASRRNGTTARFEIVAEASSAEEALETFPDQGIDLVLADLILGDGPDGIQLTKAIRADRPVLPVLVLSGRDESQFAERALLAGASTVPEGRRNGAQLALLDTRLHTAASQGCNLAMMVAAPGSASQRNAERNGFRVAYTRTKWQL